MKKRMIEILEKVCNTFTSQNRALDSRGNCVYVPEAGSSSPGCAIGMFFSDETKKFIIDNEACESLQMSSVINIKDRIPDDLWPEELEGLPTRFLKDLQLLHDHTGVWNEKGLTPRGKSCKMEILENIEEGRYER